MKTTANRPSETRPIGSLYQSGPYVFWPYGQNFLRPFKNSAIYFRPTVIQLNIFSKNKMTECNIMTKIIKTNNTKGHFKQKFLPIMVKMA